MSWRKFTKYKPALDYIIENRPKHIVEYGGGESTYAINQLLKELDYGGKITAFENDPIFYQISIDQGWNLNNSIKLVDVEYVDKTKGYLRYVHPVEEVENVDFVIIDGPNYQVFLTDDGTPSNVTDNLEVLYNKLERIIPFWIEGRSGCQNYYRELNYKMIVDYEF